MKRRISFELDLELIKFLKKRAKDNFMSVSELSEDIIRRSMLSYRKGKTRIKVDDSLVGIFSREKKGRKKKKTAK